jgi:two-component system sensor histidine kinase CpxA
LVRQVAEDAAFEAQGRGCSVRVGHCQPCATKGDGELMRRAVENVVRNAVRYTHHGTEVLIELHCANIASAALAEISVRDHGPGVPEDDLTYLFRPFFRVSEARERQTGGSGLGLAITERAVSLHHGTVWASNAPGGGLQVIILLPLGTSA